MAIATFQLVDHCDKLSTFKKRIHEHQDFVSLMCNACTLLLCSLTCWAGCIAMPIGVEQQAHVRLKVHQSCCTSYSHILDQCAQLNSLHWNTMSWAGSVVTEFLHTTVEQLGCMFAHVILQPCWHVQTCLLHLLVLMHTSRLIMLWSKSVSTENADRSLIKQS